MRIVYNLLIPFQSWFFIRVSEYPQFCPGASDDDDAVMRWIFQGLFPRPPKGPGKEVVWSPLFSLAQPLLSQGQYAARRTLQWTFELGSYLVHQCNASRRHVIQYFMVKFVVLLHDELWCFSLQTSVLVVSALPSARPHRACKTHLRVQWDIDK